MAGANTVVTLRYEVSTAEKRAGVPFNHLFSLQLSILLSRGPKISLGNEAVLSKFTKH